MTIQELITQLSACDPDAVAVVCSDDPNHCGVLRVARIGKGIAFFDLDHPDEGSFSPDDTLDQTDDPSAESVVLISW